VGNSGGVILSTGKTFVGVIDDTDKGISSVTFRVQGFAAGSQSVVIEDLAFALSGPPPGDWKLTLDENFDGDRLDPKRWTTGYTFPDVINNELQGYVPENVIVANGICTIKVEQRDCVNTDRTGRKGGAQKFASGAFTSYDKFTQTYGYFEARIKMPKARGAGIWPAFWSLPDRGRDYPQKIRSTYRTKAHGQGIEIDIFEFMGHWKTKFSGNVLAPKGEKNPWRLRFKEVGKDITKEFHTWAVEWNAEEVILTFDGEIWTRDKTPESLRRPMYLLVNLAVGGKWFSSEMTNAKTPAQAWEVDDATMPWKMECDYVRVYQVAE